MAVRKADVARALSNAADRVLNQQGRADVVSALCPKYTASQIAAVGTFGEFIQNEYGESSVSVWAQSQRDRRKVVRALRRAARQVSDGSFSI